MHNLWIFLEDGVRGGGPQEGLDAGIVMVGAAGDLVLELGNRGDSRGGWLF